MSDKEREDGILFNSMDTRDLRKEYAIWDTITRGAPNFVASEIPVTVPEVCSDGVVRSPEEYILFTSGKSVDEHIEEMRNYNRLSQLITFEFVYTDTLYQVIFKVKTQ